MSYTTKKIYGAIKRATETKTSAYDTTATVKRIEGSTAWVHIPGGVDETPVSLTINAKEGDVVQVRVGGGRAWMVGNASAPPTDDTVAFMADFKAGNAQDAAQSAQYTANNALGIANQAAQIAGDTNQYFWHTESGGDTGAHITEIKQDDFLADPANGGPNLLARSTGVAVRDGLVEVSRFGAASLQLGQDYQSRQVLDYHSLQLIDSDNNVYVYLSDLRDQYNNATIVQTFLSDGTTGPYTVAMEVSSVVSVTINGTATTAYTQSGQLNNNFTFTTAPTAGATIKITYVTQSPWAKAFTLGYRDGAADVGPLSVVEGLQSVASGPMSHAEGTMVSAVGECSHSEGNFTNSTGQSAHAEGRSTQSTGTASHSEGISTTSSGYASHSEGNNTVASGSASHSTGDHTVASGSNSLASGRHTIASQADQAVFGKYNADDTGNKYGLIVGNGGGDNSRKNALGVTWLGFLEAENTLNYGECNIAAGTAAKTVTVANPYFTLQTGACVAVKFANINSASNPTLNVNGTGPKPIMRYGTTAAGTAGSSSWNAGAIVDLMYDGSSWFILNYNNTTYTSMSDAEISAGSGTTARTITPARLKSAIWTWAPSAPSDKRLKEHLNYIDEDNIIRKLKPVHYIRDGREEYGFYAQDVEKVDSVVVGETDGYKTLNYIGLIAPLVAYCQSLERRIYELEKIAKEK